MLCSTNFVHALHTLTNDDAARIAASQRDLHTLYTIITHLSYNARPSSNAQFSIYSHSGVSAWNIHDMFMSSSMMEDDFDMMSDITSSVSSDTCSDDDDDDVCVRA